MARRLECHEWTNLAVCSPLSKEFVPFCTTMLSCETPSQELQAEFVSVLHIFKNLMAHQWSGYLNSLPPAVQLGLRERYQM